MLRVVLHRWLWWWLTVQFGSSKLRSQLNSVTPFLPVNRPKWLKRSSKCTSLAFNFSNLWNNNCLANSYNSISSAFNWCTLLFSFGVKWFSVELETVVLCWSNGMAKRKLNVSSNTYCDIYKENKGFIRNGWRRNYKDSIFFVPFDIQLVQNRT